MSAPAGMRREWTAYRAIVMHAVNQQRARGGLGLTGVLAAAAIAGIVWVLNSGGKAWVAWHRRSPSACRSGCCC